MKNYMCPQCGSDRVYTRYSEEVKTKYRFCCSRCNYSRKLAKEEVELFPEQKYGLWNSMSKRFVGNIRENSPRKVEKRATERGFNLYLWRYKIRPIPLNQLIRENVKCL